MRQFGLQLKKGDRCFDKTKTVMFEKRIGPMIAGNIKGLHSKNNRSPSAEYKDIL